MWNKRDLKSNKKEKKRLKKEKKKLKKRKNRGWKSLQLFIFYSIYQQLSNIQKNRI
jgi:hypothetical protein